jgi:hypothetical protein
MLVAILGAVSVVAGALALIYRIHAERQRRRAETLKELQSEFNELPTAIREAPSLAPERTTGHIVPDDFARLVTFLTRLGDRCHAGEVKLSEIDRRFGEWFFAILHSAVGVKVVREARSFNKLTTLYAEWYEYRVRHKERIVSTDTFAAQRWAVHTRAHTNKGRILWHHALHEEVGGAALVFWRLRFEPSYNSREILDFIETVCEDFNVDSYVVYELLGPHDLLLRCWLSQADDIIPASRAGQSAQLADLNDMNSSWTRIELMNYELKNRPEGATERCDYFLVDQIRRHWWWHDRHFWSRRKPERTLSESAVAKVKTCKAKESVTQLVDQYNAGKIGLRSVLLNKAARRYLKNRYIRWRPLRNGIKFATIIRVKDNNLSAYEEARQYIDNLLDEATGVSDRSLYEGRGFDDEKRDRPAHFLILGRVSSRRFEAIRKEIIEPVVATDAIAEHCTPTLTYVATGPEVMRRTYKDRVRNVTRAEPLAETQTV